MKLWTAIVDVIKYLASWRKRKLYQQWVEMAELPPENITHEDIREHIVREKEEKTDIQLGLKPLYIMQGAGLILVSAILIILIVQSC